MWRSFSHEMIGFLWKTLVSVFAAEAYRNQTLGPQSMCRRDLLQQDFC